MAAQNAQLPRFTELDMRDHGSASASLHSEEAGEASTSAANDPDETTVCEYFQLGLCNRGSDCPYLHVTDTPCSSADESHTDRVVGMLQMRQGDSIAEINDVEDYKEDRCWHREISGALVEFGDGATVTNVSFASDFSAVRLTNIPANATAHTLARMFARLGEPVLVDHIRITIPPQDATGIPVLARADIRAEDPEFAERVRNLRQLDRYTPTEIPTSTTAAQHLKNTSVTSLQWADSKQVLVSWQKPTKAVRLGFRTMEEAIYANEQFNSGVYKVHGRRTPGTLQHEGLQLTIYGYNIAIVGAWTVILRNVPDRATVADVVSQMDSSMQPLGTKMNIDELPPLSDRTATAVIQSRLADAGEIASWGIWAPCLADGTQYEAAVRFRTATGAAHAAKELNNKPVLDGRTEVLNVNLVHTVRFKVSAAIYHAVAITIDSLVPEWRQQSVLFTAYPPIKGFFTLKLEGAVRKDTATTKAELEDVLRGMVIYRTDRNSRKIPVWMPELEGSDTRDGALVQSKIKELQTKYNVVIICDRHKRQVRVVGAAPEQQKTSTSLVRFTNTVRRAVAFENETFVITFDETMLEWLYAGGLRTVEKAVRGVDMNMHLTYARPRAVFGDEESYQTALRVFQTHLGNTFRRPIGEGVQARCCICWTREEARDIVTTPCRHTYCRECFVHMCHDFPREGIRCNAPGCSDKIPLSLLQNNLPSESFEDLLENSFKTYIQQNIKRVRYCPAGDCQQVYRVTPDIPDRAADCFACLSCMSAVCRGCDAVHGDMDCEDFKEEARGGQLALTRAKEEFDIRECPSCSTLIQKSEGCNHITCPVCKAHICWFCMHEFESSMIYTHMMGEHEGRLGVE